MRVVASVALVMIASCRFDPTGGTGPIDEDGSVAGDAATDDAASIDAMVIDAREVDAPIIDARPACPDTYDVSNAGGRYAFRPIAMQHALAKMDCDNDLAGRTHLATFENPLGMTAAIDAVNPGNSATPWVGAKCVAPDCGLTLSWLWESNIPIAAAAWAPSQPDNGTNERVARVEKARMSGEWLLVNVLPTETMPYICECDP